MKLILILSIFVMVYIATGQHLVSKGVDRLKDEVTARGEAIKVAGSGVVDTVVSIKTSGLDRVESVARKAEEILPGRTRRLPPPPPPRPGPPPPPPSPAKL